MKVVIDMNLSPRWQDILGQAGIQAEHWSRIGAATAPDMEIMRYAAEHDLVVITHDLDFGAILAATGGGKPSVVQLRSDDTSPETAGRAVISALRQCSDDLDQGALVTVDVARLRITLLPLKRDGQPDAPR